MITVRFSQGGGRLRLTMDGHAGYAARGQDIVCAAASMLGQTLALALRSTAGAAACTRAASGQLTIICADTPETRTMFRMCMLGFGELAQGYGEWVHVEGTVTEMPQGDANAKRRFYAEEQHL